MRKTPIDGPTKSLTASQLNTSDEHSADSPNAAARDAAPPNATAPEAPKRIGRYTVRELLGQGGFADVYLAIDEDLHRQVALKLPRSDKFRSHEELQLFLEEARTSAKLQHAGIVQVFDVGTHNDAPYIVLEYIRGRSLGQMLQEGPISQLTAVRLLIGMAEAIAHAHERGFVHRDIKPQNVLLDTSDQPHIADFGLAVKQWELQEGAGHVAGTSSYMAPEQVRGETHRIDARTDIWALGVVFYRMLTGELPFKGSTRYDIFREILFSDPVPPTERAPSVSTELQRICLRCLCRQMTDRYARATELATDLLDWLELATGNQGSGSGRRRLLAIEPPDAPVVPRGLRAFEREDGDFFLRLLPGPRDREGVPTSIRFWKNRIEERDSENTFRVGVLYGPSGCGKSSLVTAGLLPRLDKQIATIDLDATPHELGTRLLSALRKLSQHRLPETGLDDTLRRMRESEQVRDGKKVLIVIDQFEQWLQAWQANPDDEIVNALRQCDGGNVQAILLVRDDFWLPLCRLMRQLEIAAVDGVNSMLVDSFDTDHACRVMQELGVAYGRLPRNAALTGEQQAFIKQAVLGLANDNRLSPVRLSAFIEMVKDRPWVPATLSEMGGTEGVGVAFLETMVGNRASAVRRMHEAAVRRILEALLPEVGPIKDRVRTRSELLAASGYHDRPEDFDAVMRLLDSELRLITHTRIELADDDESSRERSDLAAHSNEGAARERAYQLTHDFLVPSIREWLERQTRASYRGRVQLLLQEQAAIWSTRPNARYLPTFIEWLSILRHTSRRDWTRPQQQMMRAATARVVSASMKLAVASCIILGIGVFIYGQIQTRHAVNEAKLLVSNLQKVDIGDVPEVIASMSPYRPWTDPALHQVAHEPSESLDRRRRAALALLPSDANLANWLAEQLLSEETPSSDWSVIVTALKPHRASSEPVWQAALSSPVAPSRSAGSHPAKRLRALVALASFEQDGEFWQAHQHELAELLLHQSSEDAPAWIDQLTECGAHLCQPIKEVLAEIDTADAAAIACRALSQFRPDRADDLVDLLRDANPTRYRAVLTALKHRPQQATTALKTLLASVANSNGNPDDGDQVRTRANVCLALWELGDRAELRTAARFSADPRLRTEIVHALADAQTPLSSLYSLIFESALEDPCLNVALLAAALHANEPQPADEKTRLRNRLAAIYAEAPGSEVHSAAGLLLRNQGVTWEELDQIAEGASQDSSREWMLTPSGLTLAIVGPQSLPTTPGRAEIPERHAFAISTTEVPVRLYRQFDAQYVGAGELSDLSDRTPAVALLMIQMAGFCNWLSQRENIDRDQWCYRPLNEMTVPNCGPLPDAEKRLGYRLCTSAEWELACGAGAITSRFYGEADELMGSYAWSRAKSGRLLHQVGELLPNPRGLFDVYGNAREACFSRLPSQGDQTAGIVYERRGGASLVFEQAMRTPSSAPHDPTSKDMFTGFRVVRTLKIDK
ncbi:MAG: protein kinase domain-containing protein [Aureliella sp.]